MNTLEKTMIETLKDLKAGYGVFSVKAEFEAEGTRIEEAMRLKDVVSSAGLEFTIKIGGCEAMRDMYDARALGVTRVVSPMVESAFALRKFISASKQAFPKDEWEGIKFAINVETVSTVAVLDAILASPAIEQLSAVVIGRGDLSESLGLTRNDINSDKVFELSSEVVSKCRKCGLEIGIGGGVSADSIDFLKRLPAGGADYFETRKVMFDAKCALSCDTRAGILKAVGFELLWLKNKNNYYSAIQNEDAHRITHLEKLYSKMIEQVGGHH